MPNTMSETYLFRREFDAGDMLVRPIHVRIERLRLLIPAHRHSRTSYELHYTVQGRGSVTVNNIRYPISAGDMFVTGPEQMHEQLSNSDDPMVPRLLSNVGVATPFYQLPAYHVYSFLRNLLYLIVWRSIRVVCQGG